MSLGDDHNGLDEDIRRAYFGAKPKVGKPNGQADGSPPAIYSEAELAELELPEVAFIVDGLFSSGLALLSAPPKLGKTWLNFGLGRAVSTGTPFCGARRTTQGKVLMLDLEGNQRRAKKRTATVRRGEAASPDFYLVHEWPPMDAGGLELLERTITEGGYKVVIIDIWARFRPPRPRNADVYQFDYEAAKRVHEMAHRCGAAVFLTHHNRKASDGDWTAEISGSNGLTAACDTLVTIKRERGAADATMHVVGRDIEEQELALSFENGRWTILGDAEEHRMNQTRRTIYDCLERMGRPMSPKDVAEETGLKRETVKKTLQRMFKDGSVRCDSGRYAPAPGTPR